MSNLEIVFWLCLLCVLYPYLVYPLVLGLLACLRRRTRERSADRPQSVSIVLAAHNEEKNIERRLNELTELIAAAGVWGEVIVVCDGCSDATAQLARPFLEQGVHVVELPERVGKAAALSEGCARATGEVLVFADVRQTWDPQALGRLLDNFTDPTVGAASGDLLLRDSAGVLAGVALYWRYEKVLRRMESQIGSVVGATGAISAVRRGLFRPIPPGTLLDDVYWPLQVAMQGYRVVHDSRAIAYDRLPERTRDELRRKVRTLAGNFQLLVCLPAALLPWRNPLWGQLISHKLLRLVVPWALLGMLLCSLLLPGPLYGLLTCWQLTGYGLALVGLCPPIAARSRLASAAASFLVLNSAAWLAFWVWLTGKAGQSWHKVVYQPAAEVSYSSTTVSV